MEQLSFYIRLIRPEHPQWCRGTIEDLHTGEQGTFKSSEEMLRFMEQRVMVYRGTLRKSETGKD